MITYVRSSLFTSPAQVLVNTVNTVGVMGKGLARVFRDAYPEMFEAYRHRCERHEIAPGVLQLVRTPHKSILNFPTKRHWRQKSRLDDLEAGLETFVATYVDYGLTSVAFPQLGCGNGGLDWQSQVRPLMERLLSPLPVDCYIHIPPHDSAKHASGWDEDRIGAWLRGQPAGVPFSTFCADIVTVLAHHPEGGWRIASSADVPGAGLLKAGESAPESVSVELLSDLWRRLSRFGLIGSGDLPVELHQVTESLFAPLAELPYVERCVWASDWDTIESNRSPGLLYVPPLHRANDVRIIPRQADLFDDSAVA